MYKLGQKVCLWQTNIVPGSYQITVVKEVIVAITEIKTGVPGEHTGNPSTLQSLRGVGDDGKTYEKHWNVWPESQTNDFSSSWSMRDDSTVGNHYWIPAEAVYLYDVKRESKSNGKIVSLVDQNGADIKPKGDVVYCERHDSYNHAGNPCPFCIAGVLL